MENKKEIRKKMIDDINDKIISSEIDDLQLKSYETWNTKQEYLDYWSFKQPDLSKRQLKKSFKKQYGISLRKFYKK